MDLSHRNYASLFLNGAAVFILFGMIVNTAIYRKRGRKDDKVFFLMLLFDVCVSLCDIVVALANGRDFTWAKIINLTALTEMYLFLAVVAYLIPLYLIYRYTRRDDLYKLSRRVLLIPIVIIFLMYLIGVPNGYILTVDENNQYHYGKFYLVPLAVMLVYTLVSFIIPIYVKIRYKWLRHMPIFLYVIPVAAVALPYLFDIAANIAVVFAVIFAYLHMSAMNEEFFDIDNGTEVTR